MPFTDEGCCSLAIANIDPRVTESFLMDILSTAGNVANLRIIPDHSYALGGLSHGIVDYVDHASADTAMATLNGRKIYDHCIALSWNLASQMSNKKEDTSDHYHLWVGDLSSEISDQVLAQAFSGFGTMSDARVMWDPSTGKSRGYGFVSFRDKIDAEKAINAMNGRQVGSKKIRINWAHNRTTGASVLAGQAHSTAGAYSSTPIFTPPTKPSLNYKQVLAQATPLQMTVYVGNVPPNCTADMLMPVFQPYGHVADIRVTPERGFAFVRYSSREGAAMGISYVNGLVLNGCRLKCSWGKDRNDIYASYGPAPPPVTPAVPQTSYNYGSAYQGYDYSQYASQYGGYDPQQAAQWQAYYAQYYAQNPEALQQYYQQMGYTFPQAQQTQEAAKDNKE